VGDNPGLTSSRNQKWYAHATNHFWPLLHDAGFLPTPLTHLDDHKVTQHKVRPCAVCAGVLCC
jgi:G:T/U-mismatch repair DNA glycosylase